MTDVCVVYSQTYFIWLLLQFSLILAKVARVIIVPICENYGTDFQNFDFKIFRIFKILYLDFVSGTAARACSRLYLN